MEPRVVGLQLHFRQQSFRLRTAPSGSQNPGPEELKLLGGGKGLETGEELGGVLGTGTGQLFLDGGDEGRLHQAMEAGALPFHPLFQLPRAGPGDPLQELPSPEGQGLPQESLPDGFLQGP
jgi:hypothetical protein